MTKPWFQDVGALAREPTVFFPARHHTPAQQLNALVRLVLYATTGMFLYNQSSKVLYLGLAIVAVLSLAYVGNGGTVQLTQLMMQDRNSSVTQSPSKNVCRRTTPRNPFKNTLVSEYQTPLALQPLCQDDDPKDIKQNFETGLFKNIEDIYDKENSQRQYFTMPDGGVPDVKAFRDFVYGGLGRKQTCKESPQACTGYDRR